MSATTVSEFKSHILTTSNEFASHQAKPDLSKITVLSSGEEEKDEEVKWYQFGRGLKQDFLKRIPYYLDDYKDGLVGPVGTVQKTVATTLFLYFSGKFLWSDLFHPLIRVIFPGISFPESRSQECIDIFQCLNFRGTELTT